MIDSILRRLSRWVGRSNGVPLSPSVMLRIEVTHRPDAKGQARFHADAGVCQAWAPSVAGVMRQLAEYFERGVGDEIVNGNVIPSSQVNRPSSDERELVKAADERHNNERIPR